MPGRGGRVQPRGEGVPDPVPVARVQFIAFKAHLCDTAILREAVAQRLTEKQLREVLRFFGFLGGTGRELLPAPER